MEIVKEYSKEQIVDMVKKTNELPVQIKKKILFSLLSWKEYTEYMIKTKAETGEKCYNLEEELKKLLKEFNDRWDVEEAALVMSGVDFPHLRVISDKFRIDIPVFEIQILKTSSGMIVRLNEENYPFLFSIDKNGDDFWIGSSCVQVKISEGIFDEMIKIFSKVNEYLWAKKELESEYVLLRGGM